MDGVNQTINPESMGILQTGPIHSQRRKEAIDMMNAGTRAVAGEPGKPPNQAMGYQLMNAAVDLDPTMAYGWFQLGNANSDLKLFPAALAAYKRALQLPESTEVGCLDPVTKAKTFCNIGHVLYHMGRHDEALEYTRIALTLKDDEHYSWINLSLIESILGHNQEAIEAAKKSFALAPQDAVVEVGLGFAYLHGGHYAKGLYHMEARFPYRLQQYQHYPYPKWKGEPGKRVFICSEQGMGDCLDFLRFLPMAAKRCASVTLGVQAEMLRLARDMFGKIANVSIIPLPQPLPAADYWCSTMSLPVAMGLSDEEILATPLPEITTFYPQAPWKQKGKKLHIGIAWGGSPLNDVDKHRTIDVRHFLEFARVPDTQFYSLQIGDRSAEIHNIGGAMIVRDLTPFVRDVSDTIGILRHLDMVICCDTALGHIAGAIGKEAWIAIAFNATDWRFGRRGRNSIWYPNHRAYRQAMDQRWEPVFEEMISDLTERVAKMETSDGKTEEKLIESRAEQEHRTPARRRRAAGSGGSKSVPAEAQGQSAG